VPETLDKDVNLECMADAITLHQHFVSKRRFESPTSPNNTKDKALEAAVERGGTAFLVPTVKPKSLYKIPGQRGKDVLIHPQVAVLQI
jgi:hypothetical protein